MKILTIAVPAYNAEKTIEKCLDSFVGAGEFKGKLDAPDERLEVIVVNDGSKDRTAEITETYVSKYGNIIKLVNKENGGHGSVINCASKIATGRYFKVLDSDDWIAAQNLTNILDTLEKSEADVVVTSYKSTNEANGSEQDYLVPLEFDRKVMRLDEFSKIFDTLPSSYQFHGLCYRTDFYQGLKLELTEKVSYEDQEYAILPFIKAESVLLLKELFYIYRLGSEGQTVNFANQAKKLGNMETVLKRMVEDHVNAKESGNWDEARELFFTKRLSIAVISVYATAMVKAEDKKSGLKSAEELRNYLREKDPGVAEYSDARYEMLKKASKIPGLAGAYKKLADSKAYKGFKKKWNR